MGYSYFFKNGTLILVIFNHIFGTKVYGGMGSLSNGLFRTSHGSHMAGEFTDFPSYTPKFIGDFLYTYVYT